MQLETESRELDSRWHWFVQCDCWSIRTKHWEGRNDWRRNGAWPKKSILEGWFNIHSLVKFIKLCKQNRKWLASLLLIAHPLNCLAILNENNLSAFSVIITFSPSALHFFRIHTNTVMLMLRRWAVHMVTWPAFWLKRTCGRLLTQIWFNNWLMGVWRIRLLSKYVVVIVMWLSFRYEWDGAKEPCPNRTINILSSGS